jgi:hypothetical protein
MMFIFTSSVLLAQVEINIDVSDVKFERPGNPTGYCLSFISDLQFSSQASFEDAINQSKVGSLRFPMGALGDNYLWQTPGNYNSTILEHRIATTQVNPGGWDDVNDDGTFKDHVMDFDQFMSICQATNTEPVVMVNAQSHKMPGSIVDYQQLLTSAVEWVKYANITKDYNIKYWEIGNEVDLQGGKYMTKEDYKDVLIGFSVAMKAVDPTIKVGAGIFRDPVWMNYIVDNAYEHIDFLVPHQYTNTLANYDEYRVNSNLTFIPNIENALQAIKRPGGATSDRLELLVTEYSAHSTTQAYDNDNNVHFKGLINFEMLANMLTLDKRLTLTHFWITHSPWGDRSTVTEHDAFTKDNNITPIGLTQTIMGQFIKPEILFLNNYTSQFTRTYSAYDRMDSTLTVWILNKNNIAENATITLENHVGHDSYEFWTFTSDSPNSTQSEFEMKYMAMARNKSATVQLPPYSVSVLNFKKLDNVPIPTGLLDEADKAGFILYPNPCASFLTLDSKNKSSSPGTIHLDFYSATGSLLNTIQNYEVGSPINISTFAKPGLMFLRVSDEGKVANLKFINN